MPDTAYQQLFLCSLEFISSCCARHLTWILTVCAVPHNLNIFDGLLMMFFHFSRGVPSAGFPAAGRAGSLVEISRLRRDGNSAGRGGNLADRVGILAAGRVRLAGSQEQRRTEDPSPSTLFTSGQLLDLTTTQENRVKSSV